MAGWDSGSLNVQTGSWVTSVTLTAAPANSTADFWAPSSASRFNRVFPQSANTRLGSDVNDMSVIYRIQNEYPDFAVRQGSGILIRSAFTETLY